MVAVTGANGLVGSFIVKKLIEEGLPVTAVIRKNSNTDLLDGVGKRIVRREADVLDVPALTEALSGVDVVIHAAGVVSFSPGKAKRILQVNVEGTKNVVNTSLTLGVRKLIHISSVAALGRMKGVMKIDEESKWVNSPLNSDYAQSKYLAELEVYRGMEEGLNVTIINPSVVLAPAEWNNVSARLFQYVWKEKLFYTDGSINFVDVRDVAEMVFRICSSDFAGQKFIANTGVISLLHFFEEIGKRFHKKPPSIKVSNPWTGLVARMEEVRSWLSGSEPLITRQGVRLAKEAFYYDQQKAKDLMQMHFRPLNETLDWCCDHYLRKVTIKK